MVPVRKTVEISEGVKVDLLFTPRVSIYQEEGGSRPLPEDSSFIEVMERYADIMFFAALNAWELDGHGTREDFPHTRGDFHGWMSADPKGFADAVKFAVTALTGKPYKELAREGAKVAEKAPETPNEGVKKKSRRWLYRITHR